MDTYNIDELMNQAISQLQSIKPGYTFFIKDLYTGIEWNYLPKNIRIQIGKLFLNYAENNKDHIEILDKTKSNHQQYKIIK